jgi:hypothetical protein
MSQRDGRSTRVLSAAGDMSTEGWSGHSGAERGYCIRDLGTACTGCRLIETVNEIMTVPVYIRSASRNDVSLVLEHALRIPISLLKRLKRVKDRCM